MNYKLLLCILGLLLIMLISCRPSYEAPSPTSILSPTYQVDSYKVLVESNWLGFADEAPIVTFAEFDAIVEASKSPSEDIEDVYATIFAIASQHALAQRKPLEDEYFIVAAELACWWHPPGSLPSSSEWISTRPYVISLASESELARLRVAARVDPMIYAMNPRDAIEFLRTQPPEAFFTVVP